ncbi:helix-turn-helix domain-containing protein [Streptomyces sp. NPDC091292]|uniref:helix-turn-helix domain-containing protein n=1 Tax=Streptomyces sp. NPDC091292 TaxID=3365991 RepID=UPI003823B0FB
MVQQPAGPEEPGESDGQKSGRRVRYLQDEAAPSAPRMVLGNALRHRRQALGLKQEEVARRLGASPSKISRIEKGQHKFKEQDLLGFFSLYGISDPEEQRQLEELARTANQPTWYQKRSTAAQRYLQAVVSFEDMAQRIRSYESQHLHGLLQTPEYARALIERGRGSRSRHESLLQLRKERQARFAAATDKRLICVIDEAALRRLVGSPQIMRRQVEHVIDLSANPRYVIRLAELNRYNLPVELCTTTLFDFAGRILPTVAYAESFDGGLIIQDEESVDRRERAFDALRAASLTPPKTVQKLRDLLASNYCR